MTGSLLLISPWVLHRHRRLWEAPDAKTLDQLRQVYLDMEGDLESRGSEGS